MIEPEVVTIIVAVPMIYIRLFNTMKILFMSKGENVIFEIKIQKILFEV